jgi:ParB-like chromosome segregation protein Spo0J
MQVRDRIKDLRRVRAADLRPNPRNWRVHPKAQREALQGVLAEVGYADALLARELPDGTLELIDGHLRAETTPDQLVPVLVLDVTEDEAAKLLATVDPLAGMAERDGTAFASLLEGIEFQSAAVRNMLRGLEPPVPRAKDDPKAQPEPTPPTEFHQYDQSIPTDYHCPMCGYEWSGKPR